MHRLERLLAVVDAASGQRPAARAGIAGEQQPATVGHQGVGADPLDLGRRADGPRRVDRARIDGADQAGRPRHGQAERPRRERRHVRRGEPPRRDEPGGGAQPGGPVRRSGEVEDDAHGVQADVAGKVDDVGEGVEDAVGIHRHPQGGGGGPADRLARVLPVRHGAAGQLQRRAGGLVTALDEGDRAVGRHESPVGGDPLLGTHEGTVPGRAHTLPAMTPQTRPSVAARIGSVHRLALRTFRALPRPLRVLAIRWIAPAHTVGALCFVEQQGRVLLLEQHHREGWTLPGGLINRGEDAAAAVVREVREETGLEVEVGLPFAALVAPRSRRVDILFHVSVDGPVDVRADGEAIRAAWLRPEEVGTVDEPTATSFAAWARWRAAPAAAHVGRLRAR